jgi:TrmH family RNA methyltransferase
MISKNRAKFIISLQKRKIREEEQLYVIEGDKLVREFLAAGKHFKTLVAKPEFISSLSFELKSNVDEIVTVSYEELKQISNLKTPHNALGIIPIPASELKINEVLKDLCVAIDCIQDPGNMGTIIRAAGWFGIRNILCSENSVDLFNPKVIQASMGAILHVNVFYTSLAEVLDNATKIKIPVFGSVLNGESIYTHPLDNKGIILLGNESKGISDDLMPFITGKIMIPKFNEEKNGIDSLNVGMAASIMFSEFRRREC